jgi:hypothetical protein
MNTSSDSSFILDQCKVACEESTSLHNNIYISLVYGVIVEVNMKTVDKNSASNYFL